MVCRRLNLGWDDVPSRPEATRPNSTIRRMAARHNPVLPHAARRTPASSTSHRTAMPTSFKLPATVGPLGEPRSKGDATSTTCFPDRPDHNWAESRGPLYGPSPLLAPAPQLALRLARSSTTFHPCPLRKQFKSESHRYDAPQLVAQLGFGLKLIKRVGAALVRPWTRQAADRAEPPRCPHPL